MDISVMRKFMVCPRCKGVLRSGTGKSKNILTCEKCKLRFAWPNLKLEDAETLR